jgi:dipeptidyl-peptidase-4
LSLDRLFDGEEFKVEKFDVVWAKSGKGFYKMEKADPRKGKDFVYFDCASTNKEIVVPAHAFTIPGEWSSLAVDDFQMSEDESRLLIYSNSKKVWRQNTRGDYWIMDVASRELRKLGRDLPASSMMFAHFSPDGTHVAYVYANNLYVESVRDGARIQLTKDGSRTIINGTTDWVYEEELDLRDAFRWSPDGQSIAYWQIDTSEVQEFSLFNNTDWIYPRETPIPYPKTGQQNSAARAGVVPAKGGETQWLEIPGDPRNHYLAQMFWASNGVELAVQQLNRRQNENRVYLANTTSGKSRLLFTERDDAWVEHENEARWMDQGRSLLWLSERSGWRHLYKVNPADGRTAALTKGDFDVVSVSSVDETNKTVYFYASPTNASQHYLFRVGFDGDKLEQVTPGEETGTHSYDIAPSGLFAVHTYSGATRVPVTDLVELSKHKSARKLEENPKVAEKVAALKRPAVEFLRLGINSETELDAWVIKPPDFDAGRKYPLLVYVYGEPHGQTVRDVWDSRLGLWHWLLAQKGFVVASMDNRGTLSPRGRAFRKIIYRQVGLLAASDQAEGVRTLLKRFEWLDADRVGVWGWSGGGSMSLNAILRYPDLYKAAIAVASVPNQRLYDTIYQERYMGLPSENVDGYRMGSPINYAQNLKGDLLIVHGTGDDNVHYQGMETLINELIAYNKQFSMMAYPNRTHSIKEGANTTRHLFTLLTKFLETHLFSNAEKNAK